MKDKKLIYLALFNAILLIYTAWIKYDSEICPECSQNFTLPWSGVTVALAGVISSLILSLLIYLASRLNFIRYLALLVVTINASVASFLQIIQFSGNNSYCYLCLTAAIIFYLIFVVMVFDLIKEFYLSNRIQASEYQKD